MVLRLHHIVDRTREAFHNEGWAGVILRTVRKIRHVLLVTNDANWFARDLNRQIEAQIPRLPVTLDWSDNEQTIRWLRQNHDRFNWIYIPDEVCVARSCDHYLPSVKLDGKIIGYMKIAKEKAYVLDYRAELTLPPGEAFVYDTFVLPEYRGNKIASFLIAEVMSFLSQKGYRRLWCHIPAWNAASTAAFRGAGFREVAHVRFFKVLGRRLFSIHPGNLIRRMASQELSASHPYKP